MPAIFYILDILLLGDFGASFYTSSFSTTKNDDISYSFISYFNLLKFVPISILIGFGFMNTPALFTFFICSTCYSIGINRCKIPRPPCLAISIAILYSVTVSIGDETIGMLRGMFFEKWEETLHWDLKRIISKLPWLDFAVLRDHENVIESKSYRDRGIREGTLIDFIFGS